MSYLWQGQCLTSHLVPVLPAQGGRSFYEADHWTPKCSAKASQRGDKEELLVSQSDRALELPARPADEGGDSELLQECLGQPTGERKKDQGGAVVKEAADTVQAATHHCN